MAPMVRRMSRSWAECHDRVNHGCVSIGKTSAPRTGASTRCGYGGCHPVKELSPDAIERAVGGERRALEQLIETYSIVIERVVAKRLRPVSCRYMPHALEELKNELIQDFWVRVLRQERRLLRSYDPERTALSKYLRMKAWSHVTERYYRRLNLETRSMDEREAGQIPCSSEDMESRLAAIDLASYMRDELKGDLSERERRTLEGWLLGLKAREVADMLGITLDAAYQALGRARRKAARLGERHLSERAAEAGLIRSRGDRS